MYGTGRALRYTGLRHRLPLGTKLLFGPNRAEWTIFEVSNECDYTLQLEDGHTSHSSALFLDYYWCTGLIEKCLFPCDGDAED